MGQQHRLGPLEVGVAGQVGVAGLLGPAQQHVLEVQHLAGHGPAGSAGTTAAGRWPPGRCGCARCGAWPRRRRPARSPDARWRCARPRRRARRRTSPRPAPRPPGRGRPAGPSPRRRRGSPPCPAPSRGPASRPGRRRPARGRSGRLTVNAATSSAMPSPSRPCQRVTASSPPAGGRGRALAVGPGGHAQSPRGARSPRRRGGGRCRRRRRWPARGRRGRPGCAGRRPCTSPGGSKRRRTSPVTWRWVSSMKASRACLSGENHSPS